MPATESAPTGAVPSSRVERKRTARMGRILDAAAEELGRNGTSHFSLEGVADSLDVTKGSLYHYFSSKEDLVVAAIENLAHRLMVDLRDAVESTDGSTTDKFRALLDKQISVIVWEYPACVELFTLRAPDEAARRVKALRVQHDALFRGLVEDGLASGEFRVVSTSASLECVYATINMSPLWIRGSSPRTARRQIDDLIDTLMMLVGVSAAG